MPIPVILSAVISMVIFIYFHFIRPWHLHWGSSQQEVKLSLPGDHLVTKTDFNATRTITVYSSPELIWRWIIQIGSKRAGWYSIDWIDNNGIKSATEIVPEFQTIATGQFIPFTPDQKNGMWVIEFKEHDYILWVDREGNATWLWKLIPLANGETRMLTRLRTKYNWKGIWVIYYLLYDFGDIIMMRKCMKGIKKRAEKEYREINHVFISKPAADTALAK